MSDFEKLKKKFDKESREKKILLFCGALAFISTFFPWISYSFGGFGVVATTGWHSYGFLTIIGSVGLLLLWLLPKVGVKLELPAKEDVLYKALAIAILAGPVLWLIASDFAFGVMGLGFYLALASGGVAVYFSFQKVEAKKSSSGKKNKS